MKIGMVGAGMIARAVATVALRHGHEVMFSNSRGPQSLFTLQRTLGCSAGTVEEAIDFGDIVFVGIPLKDIGSIPAEGLAGKIVLDANNYYPERDGHIPELDRHETTTSEIVAGHLGRARLVKAFNAIIASDLEKDGSPAGAPDRRALPIAGDDEAAKALVSGLVDEFGFDVVDAGPLREGFRFEEGTPAYCVRMDRQTLTEVLAST